MTKTKTAGTEEIAFRVTTEESDGAIAPSTCCSRREAARPCSTATIRSSSTAWSAASWRSTSRTSTAGSGAALPGRARSSRSAADRSTRSATSPTPRQRPSWSSPPGRRWSSSPAGQRGAQRRAGRGGGPLAGVRPRHRDHPPGRGDHLMAYLTITRIAGDPGQLLDGYRRSSETMSRVGRDHGLILHTAAPSDDGLVVVNLWPVQGRLGGRRPRFAPARRRCRTTG